MKSLILDLLDRDYRLLFCWSAVPDDQTAFHEILAQFDAEEEARLRSHASAASIENWPDLVAAFRDVDLAVASRLHSVILSLVAQTPVVAISFDQKVDRVMQDLGCSRFVVDIHDFTSADVLVKLGEAEAEMDAYRRGISRFTQDAAERLDRQFDRLAAMAQSGREEDKEVALSAACPPATDVTLAGEPKADECRESR
jgi:polysaccharide pyruvyl transferase WcaK-like protein